METPNFDDLSRRLYEAKSKDDYDDMHACCWQGYLTALLEWGLIMPNQHLALSSSMPVKVPDPSLSIFLN